MSELRTILLVIGVLFVVGLFLWERRKRRGLRPASHAEIVREPSMPDVTRLETGGGTRASVWDPDMSREPTINLPEMRTRDPSQPLPVVEFPADGAFDRRTAELEEARPLRRELSQSAATPAVPAPAVPAAAVPAPGGETTDVADPAASGSDPDARESAAPVAPEALPEAPPAQPILPAPLDPAALRLAWPDEAERQIVAVRIVPAGERFLGRTVRQALAGEGFIHGPLAIFHRALADGRVVLSAASLTKPGTFNVASMDAQRYSGLNLFGVLPGPLPAAATFEDLVNVSRTLAARLGGQVQDEHGAPLAAARIAEIKAALAAGMPIPPRAPAESGAEAAGERGG